MVCFKILKLWTGYGVFSKSGCPEDSNMDSRRCNLRCAKKETRPRKGSYHNRRDEFHESPFLMEML